MANDSHSARTLGRWTDADFKSTVDRDRGAGVHADMPDETRFTSGVVRLIVRWIAEAQARSETNPRDVAMFILGANPPTPAQDAEREPMLDNGLTTIVGRLWFTSPAVISGRYITLPSGTNDDRFRFIQRHLGIGSSPIIIFDPRTTTPQLRWYPQGLDQPEEVSFLNLTGSVDAIDVSQLVDDIYRQALITPSALPGGISLWEAPDRHWPKQDAEVLLQTYIKIALIAKFPYCTVRHEQSQPSGRTDIEIEQEDAANRSDFYSARHT